MAMMAIKADIAPETTPYETDAMSLATGSSAAGTRKPRGSLWRMMPPGHYSPVGAEQPGRAPITPASADDQEVPEKPRRGWLRRMMPQEGVLRRRRWKNLGGASASRLAGLSRSLRWKRLSGLSVSLRGSWASALLDTIAFRVMYVVEAIVLGLALSCFFCCCGCHI